MVLHLDVVSYEQSLHIEELPLTLGQVTILIQLLGEGVADICGLVYVTIGYGK